MVQTASLRGVWALGLEFQPGCLKAWVVCGTVYGDMEFKDHLGSIGRVRYCIPVPDFSFKRHYKYMYTVEPLL